MRVGSGAWGPLLSFVLVACSSANGTPSSSDGGRPTHVGSSDAPPPHDGGPIVLTKEAGTRTDAGHVDAAPADATLHDAAAMDAAPPADARIPTPARGVFVLGNSSIPTPDAALGDPNVTGVALRLHWQDMEPDASGGYAWARLDSEFARAKQANKRVGLSIVAGAFTPSWVFAPGCTSAPADLEAGARYICAKEALTYDPGAPLCQPTKIPVPWDQRYLTRWLAFVAAVGAHLEETDMLPVLSHVKVTGLNSFSEELTLPRSTGAIVDAGDDATCMTSNDVASWLDAGYTRDQVRTTFVTIMGTLHEAFPNTPLAAMLVGGGLPPIDDDGAEIPKLSGQGFMVSDPQSESVFLDAGRGAYGELFVAQNNGLSATQVDSLVRAAAASGPIGFQMLWFVTNNASCEMNDFHRPCEAGADLTNAIDRGVDAGATYLEIYSVDVDNPALAGAIGAGQTALTQ